MKIFITSGLLLYLLLCSLTSVQAEDEIAEKTQLYIGIEKNRIPYTYLDEQQQPQGILIETLNTLCDNIGAQCDFVSGEFDQLLTDVQTYQLHGLVVIDSFVAPEIDRLKLTPPLCKLKPVFIQRQDNMRDKQEDFQGTTIGVRHGSLLHLYLLDAYSSLARLRPYLTQESGVFDLNSGRIDALFTDAAFFQARVAPTALASEKNPARLLMLEIDKPELPATSMTLAVRERDTELLTALEEAIQANGKTLACSCLLDTQQTEKTKSEPPAKTEKPAPND